MSDSRMVGRESHRGEALSTRRRYSTPAGWYDQSGAAKHMGVTVATIRRRHKQGLAHYRIGGRALYREADLTAWLEVRRVNTNHTIHIGQAA